MGKKPSSSKHADKLQKDENLNPSVQGLEVEPENNYPSGKVDIQTESPYPILERVELQEASKTSSTRTALKKTPSGVRRSLRLQNTSTNVNTIMSTETRDIEHIFEEITVSESEKEDDPADEKLPEHNPTSDEKPLHEKLDYIVQLLEAQKMEMDALTSRAIGKALYNESSGMGDITYKGLYIDSQKKIEALMAENNQLHNKLENALGKIEVYEKGTLVTSELIEKLKDMFFCSSLTRAAEAAMNVIAGEMHRPAAAEIDLENKGSAKRKRRDKET